MRGTETSNSGSISVPWTTATIGSWSAGSTLRVRRLGDHPPRHALGDGEGVGHHLVGVGAEREDGHEHLGGAVDLVDRQLVVVEQRGQMVRDPAERVGERVGGEDAGGSVDERLQGRGVGATGARWDGHPLAYRPHSLAA